ncbi:hypothetical protein OSSY52_08120 [Tepiditoga spiralis]|uniref:Uncharacterized protein n=1 Tax=Tepiditoga spiralis TaxID=2108365 RepID=A0A7G1G2T1_9BACT|nr:hypothetical protein [Tepiditoga spiralis]BBE30671.1 hypothetical protein OSSY52_08120 [Tepiditoga spiralis]
MEKNPKDGSYLNLFNTENFEQKFIPIKDFNAFFSSVESFNGKYCLNDYIKSKIYIINSKTGSLKTLELSYPGIMSRPTKDGKAYILSNIRLPGWKMPLILVDIENERIEKEVFVDNVVRSMPLFNSNDYQGDYFYFTNEESDITGNTFIERINIKTDAVEKFYDLGVPAYVANATININDKVYIVVGPSHVHDVEVLPENFKTNNIIVIGEDGKKEKVIPMPSSEFVFGKKTDDEDWFIGYSVSDGDNIYMSAFMYSDLEKGNSIIKYSISENKFYNLGGNNSVYEMRLYDNKLVLEDDSEGEYRISVIDTNKDEYVVKNKLINLY